MIAGNAATVWLRSPPPSCINHDRAGPGIAQDVRTIAPVPGHHQSLGSIDHRTMNIREPAQGPERGPLKVPYGGRNSRGAGAPYEISPRTTAWIWHA